MTRFASAAVGTAAGMTDDSEHGAIPVEDATEDDPRSVDDTDAALAAGGDVAGRDGRGDVEVEGPNPA